MKRLTQSVAVLSCLLAVGSIGRADKLDDDLAAAKALLVAGDADGAADKFDALEMAARQNLAFKGDDAHANYILGMVALFQGEDTLAQRSLDMAMRIDPKSATYVSGRAQLSLYQKKPKEAVGLLQRFLETDGKNAEVLGMLGDAQLDAGQYAEAQGSFSKALDAAPKEAKYAARAGDALVALKKEDDALGMYDKAIALDGKLVAALASEAKIYQQRKDYDKAIVALGKLVAATPDDYLTRATQVQMFEAAGRLKERDAAIEGIRQLHHDGKMTTNAFCREQFGFGKMNVMAMDYCELKEPQWVRFAFNVIDADGRTVIMRVSVGKSAANEAFKLDAYTEKSHEVLQHYKEDPTYEQARSEVKEYLKKAMPAAAPPATTTQPTVNGTNVGNG